jgi:hypothetical protein
MSTATTPPRSFRTFAVLMALGAAAHVAVHLSRIELSLSWTLGVSVFCGAMWLIYRPTVSAFACLALLQIASVIVDAPYNPDHWLLIFFVNVLALGAMARIRHQEGAVSPQRLMEVLEPGARLVFLVCYGFAALAKYNRDFLFSPDSVARELLGHQVGVMPLLGWVVWPPAVPWLTVACETAVPLLLIPQRTRHLGIVVGLLFHAALMISPAVAVFDFTIAVYLMLYLFTPADFDRNVRSWWNDTLQRHPVLHHRLQQYRWSFSVVPAVLLVAVSLHSSMGELSVRLAWLRWTAAMVVVCGSILSGCIGLYSRGRQSSPLCWFPRWGLAYSILGLALLNGLCPYLGLKTQGSFTMFSNLRTEAGAWNHLLIPETVRCVEGYQDRLVHIAETDDPVLKQNYVDRGLLATEFEVRRRITMQPSISLTVQQGEQLVVVDPATDPVLGAPLDLISRKLLIFRPVSPEGRPFVTN